MRCQACNCELTDKEATLKDDNGEFFDLCRECLESAMSAVYVDSYKWNAEVSDES